jgi:flagellar hook-basal body complex protein FliE
VIPLEGPKLGLIAPHPPLEAEAVQAPQDSSAGALFEELLKNAGSDANAQLNEAQAAGEAFARGTRDDIHGTMLALSKAEIELRLVGNIRNKVVDAFYELWRMQI